MPYTLKEGEQRLLACLPSSEPLSPASLVKKARITFGITDEPRAAHLLAHLAYIGLAEAMTLNHNEGGTVGYRATSLGQQAQQELDKNALCTGLAA